ncbi:SAM-dependent methyltransferase [Dickeya oryzae]
MGDLLLLDYSHHQNVRLIGVDLDYQALEAADSLARQQHCDNHITLLQSDAWSLQLPEPVDILTSNGLNVYEQDDERVTNLYRAFNHALKPGGILITSFFDTAPGVVVGIDLESHRGRATLTSLTTFAVLTHSRSKVDGISYPPSDTTPVGKRRVSRHTLYR